MRGIMCFEMALSVVLFMLAMQSGYGQISEDARGRALGDIGSMPDQSWSAGNNPAGLAMEEGLYAGLSFSSPYLMNEMQDAAFSIGYGFGNNGVGLSGAVLGFHLFSRQCYQLSYGRKFGNIISSGLSLVLSTVMVPGLSSVTYAATFKLALIYPLKEKMDISFVGTNPFGIAYSSIEGFNISPEYILGFANRPRDNLLMVAEISSDTDLNLVFKAGFEYGILERFFLRIGALSHPLRLTSGIGICYSRLSMDIVVQYHSFLGFSPGITLTFKSFGHETTQE